MYIPKTAKSPPSQEYNLLRCRDNEKQKKEETIVSAVCATEKDLTGDSVHLVCLILKPKF